AARAPHRAVLARAAALRPRTDARPQAADAPPPDRPAAVEAADRAADPGADQAVLQGRQGEGGAGRRQGQVRGRQAPGHRQAGRGARGGPLHRRGPPPGLTRQPLWRRSWSTATVMALAWQTWPLWLRCQPSAETG